MLKPFTKVLFVAVCILATISTATAADPAMEDLLKRSEGTSGMSAPSIQTPGISPAYPSLQKPDQPRVPAMEKVKLTGGEPAVKGAEPKKPAETEAKRQAVPEALVPSALEKLITADEILEAGKVADGNTAKGIQQFGYSFFRATEFSPQLDVPVSPDYLIGPGDSLVVTLWGSVEGNYDLTVSRSGEILLPKVGPIRVAGLPFGALPDVLKGRLAKIYRDFDLSVNMGRLRTIKVYLVGEVASPGDYSISGLSTLINALSAAGGPTKNGSLRNIKVRRADSEETVDLYEFFMRGDKSRDVRLQSGDTIFVPVIGPVAAISGNVRRPAIYELKSEKNLKDLLALAEGITATGYLQRVQISRVVANEKKRVIDLDLDPIRRGKNLEELAAAVPIHDLDVVRVFAIDGLLRDHIRIEGHLQRPGFYALTPGLRISSILQRDQLLPEYHPRLLAITRLVPPELHPEKILVNLDSALSKDPAHDLELREYDTLRIFSRWEMEEMPKVRVSGEVQKPGEFRLFPNMTVRDLLLLGGNPKLTAYLKQAELTRIRKSGDSVTSFPIRISIEEALKGNPEHNLPLEPFDELSVRRIPNWSEETERYVTLHGEFVFPGTYPVFKGERLSSVIARAGGFTDKAYLRGARFTREPVRQLQQKRMEEVIARTEEEILRKSAELSAVAASKEELEATRAALESLRRSVELLKTKKAEGRVVIALSPPGELAKGPYDVELAGGDALYVPQDPKVVSVLGQVYNPTSFIHIPGRDAKNYLSLAGGPSKEADEGEIYLVRVDGTVISKKQAVFWFFNNFMSRDLDSGDTVVVPQRFEKIAWMRDIKDIATILGQLALTAGVIVAAGL